MLENLENDINIFSYIKRFFCLIFLLSLVLRLPTDDPGVMSSTAMGGEWTIPHIVKIVVPKEVERGRVGTIMMNAVTGVAKTMSGLVATAGAVTRTVARAAHPIGDITRGRVTCHLRLQGRHRLQCQHRHHHLLRILSPRLLPVPKLLTRWRPRTNWFLQ